MTIPDLNVLLYALNSDAAHHDLSARWLQDEIKSPRKVIGLAWVVSLGFLRLSCSPRLFQRPLTVEQSLDWIDRLRKAPSVRELSPGRAHWGILKHLLLTCGTGGNLTTDAHLAAIALEQDAEILTFDRDFLRFEGVRVKFLA